MSLILECYVIESASWVKLLFFSYLKNYKHKNMKKKFYLLFSLAIIPFLMDSCCGGPCKSETWVDHQIVEKYRFNSIVILGESTDTKYVEVWYSEAAENGKNKLVHKRVTPPVIIGGHYSYVTFDKLAYKPKGDGNFSQSLMVTDYSKGGSHYMKVVNHSSKPIEYFIAGTHPIKTLNLEGSFDGKFDNGKTAPSMEHTYVYPRVIYNNTPVYFLLYPKEKLKRNYYEFNVVYSGTYPYAKLHRENFEILDFSSKRESWSMGELMGLYRKEYKEGGVLKLRLPIEVYKPFVDDYGLSKRERVYYGFIKASDSLVSNDKTPFITDYCGDVGYGRGFKCVSERVFPKRQGIN